MPRSRWGHSVGLVENHAFILGGCDNNCQDWHTVIDVCDLDSLVCSETEWNIPRTLRSATVVELNAGIVILGGVLKNGDYLSDVVLFNPATGVISNTAYPPLPFYSDSPSAGVFYNRIHIFGGNYSTENGVDFHTSIYVLSDHNSWDLSELQLEFPLGYSSVVTLPEMMGIIGGANSSGVVAPFVTYYLEVEIYSPLTQE